MERPLVTLDPQQRQEAEEFVRVLARQTGALDRERSRYVGRIKAELVTAADRAREIDEGLFPEEDAVVWERQYYGSYVRKVPLLLVSDDQGCMVVIDFKGILHPNPGKRYVDGKWFYYLHYPDQTEDDYYLTYGGKALEAIAQRVKSHLPQESPA